MISIIGAFLLLLPCTVTDVRNKEIPAVYVLCFAGIVFLGNMLSGRISRPDVLFGAAVGAIFFLISFCTKEQLGYGDDMMILALGVWLGGRLLMEILMVSFMTASLTGIIFLAFDRKNRGRRLPFAPFMTVGAAVCFMIQAVAG